MMLFGLSCSQLFAYPHSEMVELRETMRLSPRFTHLSGLTHPNRVQSTVDQQNQENQRSCWSIFAGFCNLMRYATPPYPSYASIDPLARLSDS